MSITPLAVVDRDALQQALRGQGEDFFRHVSAHFPNLFALTPVLVTTAQVAQMQTVIAAVERVVKLPEWPGVSNADSVSVPPLTSRQSLGVFFGYDFHLNGDATRLIEINTNAGGAFLNAVLLDSQRHTSLPGIAAADDDLEQVFLAMFRNEWRRVRGDAPLKHVAIVDENPETQYLYPEFLLAKNMFERAGISAHIVDPAVLLARDDGLYINVSGNEQKIDLVYNRLTDFWLQRYPLLLAACQQGNVVLTPHPRAYTQYADKRNLARLTDASSLRTMGASETDIATLQTGIPPTVVVRPDMKAMLWAERKQWFFKPAAGFGSKGSYRGANVTTRVFNEILQNNYVAQRWAPPGQCSVPADNGQPEAFKFDVRCYVYDSKLQLIAARLYQGQTTNFRTPGGGFALVRVVG